MRTADEILAEVKLLTNQALYNRALSPAHRAAVGYACNALMWALGGSDTYPISDLLPWSGDGETQCSKSAWN